MIHLITAITVADAKELGLAEKQEPNANSRGSVWLTFDIDMNRIYRGRLPYCGTARVLLEKGLASPEDILQGQTIEGVKTLHAPVGTFARLTVRQDDPVRVPGGNRGGYMAEVWATYKPRPEQDDIDASEV